MGQYNRRRFEISRKTVNGHWRKLVALAFCLPCITFFFIAMAAKDQIQERYRYRTSMFEESTVTDSSPDDGSGKICFTAVNKVRRKAVLIFAVMRSGSSFLGELFNQHSEVYYLYEPLHGIKESSNSAFKRRQLLHDLLKCDYSRVEEFYKNSAYDEWIKCKSNVCFADRSMFLWRNTDLCEQKPPYCGVDKLDPYKLSRVCHQSLFAAVKIIKLHHLKELEPILLDPELDLRVIQLVRDPRAIASSRMKIFGALQDPESFVSGIKVMCNDMYINFRYAENCIFGHGRRNVDSSNKTDCDEEVSNLWKGRFMRISHEYMSMWPFAAFRDVYGVTEVNYDTHVHQWIAANTKSEKKNLSPKTNLPDNFYDTSRISKKVLNQWREELSMDTIRSIQMSCKSAMNALGYVTLDNDTQQLDFSRKLFNYKTAVKISSIKMRK